ncbi:putative bifunctional diguanylate cyclase/phosphodiesterase [Tepidiforma bonchosmolovskayae]|uniref:Bifunctional diguanylate cyclase/phosphodiesterase n=1 Tax=Tepidiforma bonchosmolovskayae TaxID=2601677 RepID=A0ABX6BZZ4_9CHLR|nr:sensor domain-containing phosphodiesterase [Tepidiforma bonchosmolovskayae]QFG02548.1 bifunctional diguanylate cyclase/phosphodiesterase [Tepidiforma bonchosmolovskayae]
MRFRPGSGWRVPLAWLWASLFGAAAIGGPAIHAALFAPGRLELAAEAGAAVASAGLAAAAADRVIRRPLLGLRTALLQVQAGDLDLEAPPSPVREIDELGADLHRSLASLQVSTDSLIYRAFHDPLTDLPNRAMFLAAFARALSDERRPNRVAILFMDVDRFKYLNDTLGHGVGDQLLSVFAQRLVGAAEGHMVARLGGDEFTVLVRGEGAASEAVRVARRVLQALRRPFSVAGQEMFVTSSIGIAVNGAEDRTTTELLRKADVALYRAKSEGRARFVVYSAELDADPAERFDLDNGLRRAVERNELQLLYQPIVDLETGALVGMEALLRWNHPHRGVLSPATFIAVAEETGEIVRIGNWVMEEACRETARVQQLRPGLPLTVSVNISAAEFRQADLPGRVRRILESTGLEPHALTLELTESVLLHDTAAAMASLDELGRLGVGLALDDFGTGYSSLSYLQRLPVDTLKIDQSFVGRLGADPASGPLTRAIVEMGHALGMRVVAEGVETEWQLAYLREIGCQLGQGRLFAGPLAAEQFRRLAASLRPAAAWGPLLKTG